MSSPATAAVTAADLSCSREIATKTFIVCAECHLDDEEIFEEDRDAIGEFLVKVPAHLPEGIAAACALGIFHSVVAIKYLHNFYIQVLDEECGREVKVDHNADIYRLANSCKELWHYVVDQYEGGDWD